MSTRILKNTSAYMLAGLLPNIVNLILLPFYTRAIPPAEYGINALVSTTCSFLASFSGLQLGSALTRFYVTYTGEKLRRYFSTLFWFYLGVTLLIFLLLQACGPWMTQNLFGNSAFPYFPYLFLGSFQFLFLGLTAFLNIALRMQERGGRFLGASLTYTTVDFAVGIYLVLFQDMGIVGLLTARAISSGVYVLLLLHALRPLFTWGLDMQGLRESIRFSVPTIPHSMANTVFNFADKFILGLFLNTASVGLYDLANRFSRVFQQALSAFERAYVPDFIRRSEADKAGTARYMQGLIAKWTVITMLCGIGLTLYAEEIIRLMAAPEYRDAYSIVPVLVMGCVMRGFYFFPANAILFEKKTHLIPVITVTSGLLNIIFNVWLIPVFQTAMVAAWTTAGSLGFSFFFSWLLVRPSYRFIWPWKTIACMLAILGLSMALVIYAPFDSIWVGLAWKTGFVLGLISLILVFNAAGLRQDVMRVWDAIRNRSQNPA